MTGREMGHRESGQEAFQCSRGGLCGMAVSLDSRVQMEAVVQVREGRVTMETQIPGLGQLSRQGAQQIFAAWLFRQVDGWILGCFRVLVPLNALFTSRCSNSPQSLKTHLEPPLTLSFQARSFGFPWHPAIYSF